MVVSCLMPTRGRPDFAVDAVSCFRCQTWLEKELVIIDDADNPSFPVPPEYPNIRYERLAKRLPLGAKRNICCSRAAGEILCHWDDDDWSAPERLADQIARLGTGQITGYHSMRFTDGSRWWHYSGAEDYALGTSLMYRRSYWEQNPFKSDCSVGEDGHFIAPARKFGTIISADAGGMMFATIHHGNSSPRNLAATAQWREIR